MFSYFRVNEMYFIFLFSSLIQCLANKMPRAPSSKRGTASGAKERVSKKAAQLDQYQFDDDNQDELLDDVRGRCKSQCNKIFRGVGIVHFNMVAQGVAGGKTPKVQPLTAYVLPYHLKTKSI